MIVKCSYYGPTKKSFNWLTKFEDTDNFGFGLITAVQSDSIAPVKFNDAWNHPNQKERKLWRDAIRKELNSMNKKNVWKIVPKTEIPQEREPIGFKWVLKIKRDGRYRA